MLDKLQSFIFLLLVVLLCSCVNINSEPLEPGAGNKEEYATALSTVQPEVFPVKNEENEVVVLLRRREQPFDMLVVSLVDDCLTGIAGCDETHTVLAKLPKNLSQVLSLTWTKNGSHAFFWDQDAGDIYILDVNNGTSNTFKKEIWKIRDGFLVSPLGDQMVFEVQKNSSESDLVAIDINSGELSLLYIPESCMKVVRAWLSPQSFMFWCERYSGDKGNLENIEVYVYDFATKKITPFDIGYDWMKTSVPLISPNTSYMAFTTVDKIIIRDSSSTIESTASLRSEKLLWSLDSKILAIYDQNKEIYSVLSNGSDLRKIFSLSTIGELEDWMWLSDNEHILLLVVDDAGNRQMGILSIEEKKFKPITFSLLNDYDPVSFSLRP